MKKIIYSAMYHGSFPFSGLAEQCIAAHTADSLTEADSYLLLWGGADISPSLYFHEESKQTGCYGMRDEMEWGMVQRAIAKGIPIIGVCRGAQMLCAAAGGYLFQHTTHHAGPNHIVETYTGEKFVTNSIHHQMMCVPDKVDHVPLAWTPGRLSTTYIYDGEKEHEPPEKELECVWFPKIKGFAVQWHPEGMNEHCPATQFVLKEINAKTNYN